MLSCLDARTGQAFYTQERVAAAGSYYASPIAADGRVYVCSLPGKLTIVKAGNEKRKRNRKFCIRLISANVSSPLLPLWDQTSICAPKQNSTLLVL